MNNLPLEIENIIIDYKMQMDHREKFAKSIEKINNIHHTIMDTTSYRVNDDTNIEVEMYGGHNMDERSKGHYEFWCHRYTTEREIIHISEERVVDDNCVGYSNYLADNIPLIS